MSEVEHLLAPDNYYNFTRRLEKGPHNYGHDWIGGDMNSIESPRDAAFWFHHAQVDRIWALWQQEHSNEIADLQGTDAVLDPWELDIHDVNNIRDLGYEYVEPGGTPA